MRKTMGILLTAVLVLQMMWIPTVSAAVPTPLIEVDLSAYNDATGEGIVNTGSSSTASISVLKKMEDEEITAIPKLKTMTSAVGEETEYLEFMDADGNNKGSYLKVQDAAILNQNAITYEMWMMPYSSNNSASFIGTVAATDGTNHTFEMMRYGNGYYIKPTGKLNSGYEANRFSGTTADVWKHYVLTRQYDSSTKTWTTRTYINGEEEVDESGNAKVLTKTNGDALNETADHFTRYGGSFGGCIGGVKIYDKVLTAVQIKEAYENSQADFTPPAETMGLASVSNIEDISELEADIPASPDTIELTFDNFVDKSTIDNITFTGKSGSAINGQYTVYAGDGEYTKTVYVKYGYLEENKDYALNIGSGLKSINGIAYDGESRIVYHTTSNLILYEDFQGDDYVVGEAPPTDKGLIYTSAGAAEDASGFEVAETRSGDKYITGVSQKKNSTTGVTLKFDPEWTQGSYAIELGIKGMVKDSTEAGTATRDVMRFYKSSVYGSLGSLTSTVKMGGTVSSPDSDGFNYIKVVATKDADGKFVFDYYTKTTSTSYTRVKVNGNDGLAFEPAKLVKVMLAHVYPTSDAQVGADGFAITSINAYRVSTPGVFGGTEGAISKTTEEIEVNFDSPMDEESLENATYTLADASGENTIEVEYGSYDASTYTLTLALKDYLLTDVEYSLSIDGATNGAGSPLIAQNVLTISAEEDANTPTAAAISSLTSGATEIAASIDLPDGAEVTYILVLFDENGRISAVKSEEITGVTNNITMTIEDGVEVGDTARLFIWKKTSETEYSSVIKPCIVKCE